MNSASVTSSSLVAHRHRILDARRPRRATTMRKGWCSSLKAQLSDAHHSFLGKWTRDATKNENVFEYLEAHDMDGNRSTATYEQNWKTSESDRDGEFTVTTISSTGTNRTLVYPLGEFVETYEGDSNIFGPGPGEVYRKATWDETSRKHEVTSASQLGFESTTRTTDESGNHLTCVRRFMKKDGTVDVSCTEHFVRP